MVTIVVTRRVLALGGDKHCDEELGPCYKNPVDPKKALKREEKGLMT